MGFGGLPASRVSDSRPSRLWFKADISTGRIRYWSAQEELLLLFFSLLELCFLGIDWIHFSNSLIVPKIRRKVTYLRSCINN